MSVRTIGDRKRKVSNWLSRGGRPCNTIRWPGDVEGILDTNIQRRNSWWSHSDLYSYIGVCTLHWIFFLFPTKNILLYKLHSLSLVTSASLSWNSHETSAVQYSATVMNQRRGCRPPPPRHSCTVAFPLLRTRYSM